VSDGGNKLARFVVTPTTLSEVSYAGEDIFTIDPTTQRVSGKLTLPLENSCFPTYGDGSLWLLAYSSASAEPEYARARGSGNRTRARDGLTSQRVGLVFGGGDIWGISNGWVFRLDPATNTVVAHIRSNAQPSAYADGSIRALGDKRLVRINPAKNRITATIKLPGPALRHRRKEHSRVGGGRAAGLPRSTRLEGCHRRGRRLGLGHGLRRKHRPPDQTARIAQ
jgi:hypothetical protein